MRDGINVIAITQFGMKNMSSVKNNSRKATYLPENPKIKKVGKDLPPMVNNLQLLQVTALRIIVSVFKITITT